jgi:hypothetical protein
MNLLANGRKPGIVLLDDRLVNSYVPALGVSVSL